MKKNLLLFLVLLCLILNSACGNTTSKATRFMLDSTCTITISDKNSEQLLEQCFAMVADYEQLFSRTIEGSDIWRINHAGGQAVEVADSTIELIQQGLSYGELSQGSFDISIGQLSTLWGFGSKQQVPSAEDIDAARQTIDYRSINIEGNSVRLSNPQTMLDLGGIAKGYIADRLAQFLREAQVEWAIIDLAGNIVTLGSKPDRSYWNIGIDQPFSHRTALVGVISFGNSADEQGQSGSTSIVTSGIYERNFTVDGQLYHHILDPHSGYPSHSELSAVTIISNSSADGDALSTTCLLLGYEQGSALLSQLPGVRGAIWQFLDESIIYDAYDETVVFTAE